MRAKKVHVVPLSDQALAILEDMEAISGGREYIFPGVKDPAGLVHALQG